jgi:hypothetical protein
MLSLPLLFLAQLGFFLLELLILLVELSCVLLHWRVSSIHGMHRLSLTWMTLSSAEEES